jgi:ADYC domain
LTEDDAAARTQRSGSDKPVDPGSEFPESPALLSLRDDLRSALEGQARIGVDPNYGSGDRRDNEPGDLPMSGYSEGAPVLGDARQQMLADPQAAMALDSCRQPAAAEIQASPVGPPLPPFEGTASGAIVAAELSADKSGVSRNRGLVLCLRWSATVALAAMILCGCTVAIGFDHLAAPGEVIANSDLRIVAGHFASVGNFGFGPGGPVGRIIEANGMRLRIDAAAADPHDATGEVTLYRFSRLDADGAATPYCQGDYGGLGFPMAGVWTAGVHTHAPGQISVICLGTAAARCVDLGYRPWRKTPNGADLWNYHQACVRALRADYCGTGQSHGDEQHGLALYDRLGIQPLRAADGMSFEAAWDADGASCVNHMRVPARMTLKDLRTECANLPKARLGNSCDERDPALIFTKSPSPPASQPPA